MYYLVSVESKILHVLFLEKAENEEVKDGCEEETAEKGCNGEEVENICYRKIKDIPEIGPILENIFVAKTHVVVGILFYMNPSSEAKDQTNETKDSEEDGVEFHPPP